MSHHGGGVHHRGVVDDRGADHGDSGGGSGGSDGQDASESDLKGICC